MIIIMIYSLVILLARNIISYLSRLVKISIYIIIYSSNDNATSLIYYTLQLRKIVLASRGRVACAPSRDRSFKSARQCHMPCVHSTYIYYIYIYLYIYLYISHLSNLPEPFAVAQTHLWEISREIL